MELLSTVPNAHPTLRQRLSAPSNDERQTLPPCDICWNDYGPEERPVKLPCNHIFGEKCILTWARGTTPSGRYNGCPTCRAEIFPPTVSSRLTGFKHWHAVFCHQFVILAGGKIGLATNVAVWTLNVFVRMLPASPMRSFLRVLMFVRQITKIPHFSGIFSKMPPLYFKNTIPPDLTYIKLFLYN